MALFFRALQNAYGNESRLSTCGFISLETCCAREQPSTSELPHFVRASACVACAGHPTPLHYGRASSVPLLFASLPRLRLTSSLPSLCCLFQVAFGRFGFSAVPWLVLVRRGAAVLSRVCVCVRVCSSVAPGPSKILLQSFCGIIPQSILYPSCKASPHRASQRF